MITPATCSTPPWPSSGFARGSYDRRADDGFELVDCRVTNAVRCVPPENKPLTEEVKTCRDFLVAEFEELARLSAVLALGTMAHGAVLSARGLKKAPYPFRAWRPAPTAGRPATGR